MTDQGNKVKALEQRSSVSGDAVEGDKVVTQTAGGDIVGGDKITHAGTGHIFAGSGDVLFVQAAASPASARDRANLRLLRDKVKSFWIKGVLERSAHNAFLLELGRELRTDAIDHPWASILELPDTTQRLLPPDVSDVQVFDDANRALLILGEPGSGKTTTMLEIARDLIARAEADAEEAQPIPVVFNLSSWEVQRRALSAWLVAELTARYQVPPALGRTWLAEQRLLPLLDGLDEVEPASQEACVRAINALATTQGLPGLVVCCRTQEYTRLPVRLRLNAAIGMSPLTAPQIDAYLEAGGAHLAALRALLQTDEALSVLAQTPLFLSIMCLAYQDMEPTALASPVFATVEQRRGHLLEQYVARMLKRKGQRAGRNSDATLLRWLSWLARQMAAHNQSVFLAERIQPSWLDTTQGRWAYALAARIALWTILGCALTVSVLVLAATIEPEGASLASYLASTLSGAVWLNRLDSLLRIAGQYARVGLIAGLICGIRFILTASRGSTGTTAGRSFWRVASSLFATVVVPVGVVAVPAFIRSLSPLAEAAGLTPAGAIFYWVPVILAAAIALRGWEGLVGLSRDIPTVDTLAWSWPQSLKGGLAGFTAGAVLMSGCIWTVAQASGWLDRIVTMAACSLPMGLLGGLVAGTVAGLRARTFVGAPYSGNWLARQLRNTLAAGLVLGLVITLAVAIVTLSLFFAYAEAVGGQGASWEVVVSGLGAGLTLGTAGGAVAAFFYGGAGLTQRSVLRLILAVQRRLPWRLTHLADWAEDLVFLRRVGGGYIFIHRLVLEYFAALPER